MADNIISFEQLRRRLHRGDLTPEVLVPTVDLGQFVGKEVYVAFGSGKSYLSGIVAMTTFGEPYIMPTGEGRLFPETISDVDACGVVNIESLA